MPPRARDRCKDATTIRELAVCRTQFPRLFSARRVMRAQSPEATASSGVSQLPPHTSTLAATKTVALFSPLSLP